jgi:hypothetical protein
VSALIVDCGPIFAYLSADDPDHLSCSQAEQLPALRAALTQCRLDLARIWHGTSVAMISAGNDQGPGFRFAAG